jgi:DNA-binding response OmpR family regulator
MNKQENIKILLVCDNEADVVNIKYRVESHDNISFYIWQCPTLSEGIGYLDIKKLRADIVILDLGLKGTETPKEAYRQMGIAADDIPIIVITGKGSEEHDLAAFVMQSGAADNMIRGEFSGLTDAMEFALIRQKITKDEKIKTDKTLQDSKDVGDAQNLKEKQDHQSHLSMFMGGYSASDHGSTDETET